MINWGLASGNGAQNAFITGLRTGQSIKQQQQSDALIEQHQQQQQQAQDMQARFIDLRRRVLAGDESAKQEMAALDTDYFNRLTDEQKAEYEAGEEALANAAFDIMNSPPEQRSAKWDQYAQQLGRPEYVGQYSDAMLNAMTARAGLSERIVKMQQPKYMAIPEGATLVDTRNPGAVAQFGGEVPAQPQILPRTSRPAGKSDDDLFAEARQAVEAGADVDTVFRQLREWGVTMK